MQSNAWHGQNRPGLRFEHLNRPIGARIFDFDPSIQNVEHFLPVRMKIPRRYAGFRSEDACYAAAEVARL